MNKIKCKKCAAQFVPVLGPVVCPECHTPQDADTAVMHASALAALPDLGSDGALPADIQVFPPGRGVKFTLQDFPGQEFELDVDASTARILDDNLQLFLARAASGAGSEPFADKNHEDAEKTFTPVRYFWGGEDKVKGGVRLVPDWVPFGAALVRAKAFKYFSQNFLFSKAKKKVLGLINENVGGLVNRPGFATQAAFAKAAPSTTTTTNEQNMTTEEFKKIVDDALKPVVDKVTALEAKAKAAETAVPAKAAADNTVIAAINDALKPVTEQLTQFRTQQQDALKAQAKASVAKYIGRVGLPPQDTKAIEFWEKNYLADPAGTEDQLSKLPARAAGVRYTTTGTGTTAAAAATEPEDVFAAKAKAWGETNKITDEVEILTGFARTAEGAELQDQFRAKVRATTARN
jgi:Mu-like prophage I protein